MKDWFPLANYDFYAYLTAGMIVLAAFDYSFGAGALVARTEWTFPAGVFWAAIAYICGHLVAGPSSLFLEQLLVQKVLGDPTDVILGRHLPAWPVRALAHLTGAREYRAFPEDTRQRILANISTRIDEDINALPPDAVFNRCYVPAMKSSELASKAENFLNAYGLCRNVCFSLLISAAFISARALEHHEAEARNLILCCSVGAAMMFGRYLKFYAAFTRIILRAVEASPGPRVSV